MARVCELTGIKVATGNLVSHSNIHTRTRWLPNLKTKKYLIPELGQTISVRLSTRAIRTVDKLGGITPALMKAKDAGLSERLLTIKNKIAKKARKSSAPKAK
jgi:large subunit ribosomal protein L28